MTTQLLELGSTLIEDTFAEAFDMRYACLEVTAVDRYWLQAAVDEFCGYSSSVIACDAETGVDHWLSDEETFDGRVGAQLLVFGFSRDALSKSVVNRAGQCLMTCPTTAVYNGMPDAADRIPLGKHIRYFGDGFQKSKLLGTRRFWRVPVMDGEFIVESMVGIGRGVAGGNLLLQGVSQRAALEAARRGVEAVRATAGVIAPFPGGVARSGSKVGSRYPGLKASTADAYCPTLKGRVASKLHPEARCCYEIVIDGITPECVAAAMTAAIKAAVGDGLVAISAGNYGGKLGKHQFHLRELLAADA